MSNPETKEGKYDEAYRLSIENPQEFWAAAARNIHWYHWYDKVLEVIDNHYRWFVGGCMNSCYNAVDLHVHHGDGDRTAIIYDSPVTNTIKTYTYRELQTRVAKTAWILKLKGVKKGDTVLIYMPMIPEALIAMLACARIGAIHTVVFGGFGAHELALRIEDAKPAMIISASCGIEVSKIIDYKEILDSAVKQSSHKVNAVLLWQRPQKHVDMIPFRDIDWEALEVMAKEEPCTPLDSIDPLYILYTSGTTGKPKGVIRSNGGHCVAMKWTMDNIYATKPGDVFLAASDVGWVVGHSYIVYAPLFNGSTTVVYEGKPVRTPDAGVFWRMIEQHKINVLFAAPTAFRAIKKEDPKGELIKKYNLSSLRSVFVAGERCDTDTLKWIEKITKRPVIDHWWQTETGWAISGNPIGLEMLKIKPGSSTKPMPGFNLKVLDEDGKECKRGKLGNLVLKLPLPPACLLGIWKDDERYKKSYLDHYPGYYLTGDSGYIDEDGYVFVMGRMDGVINVAGHRISTGALEESVSSHPSVAECAVVGIDDDFRGEVPLCIVVLKDGVTDKPELIKESIIRLVIAEVGAFANLKIIGIAQKLPKTRSGKILRGTIRSIAEGKEYTKPSTIEDETSLAHIESVIRQLGFPKVKDSKAI
ncbi:propionyl-CoA synthetase [Helicobacter muridarum]|uniref:Acetyl-CoA synthetase n=1 Tax=Helicobacter muridarum TaxID=216 RepID=A0A099TXK9_9HELI|nr:AMP-binding protein [Helicobacter muridarum]TLD98118.1 propionyl-CoA synthetase [Helicobacter muridarum]STQ85442.1 acetyl-CoA synthetase [Helicobacter muridarum]